MNTEQKQAIIKECLRIAKGGKPKDEICGLCSNLTMATGCGYKEFPPLFDGWPEHSGNRSAPIPDYPIHLENNTLWTGEQGKLRRSLARYIAKQLKATL